MSISSKKTFSVKEVADMLGISEFTVRRRIQDGQLTAVMDSKKQGYHITEESLTNYAKSIESKVGSIWKKTPIALASMIPSSLPLLKFLPLMGGIINDRLDSKNLLRVDLNSIDNVAVIDKIIERLNIELEGQDLQSRYLEFKIAQMSDDTEKLNEQEKLFKIESQKLQIRREIKDWEIRKTVIETDEP